VSQQVSTVLKVWFALFPLTKGVYSSQSVKAPDKD